MNALFDGSLIWLRPWALYLTILVIPIVFFSWQAIRKQDQWQKVVDNHLLQFLLQQGEASRSRWPLILLAATLLIAIVALAGPSWQQQSIPVYRSGEARVVLFDMSFSMDAIDVKPSRINRARHKLKDILSATDEGEIALIVYAGDAFIISPLTSDANTIANMVPILNTGLMPIFGSEPVTAFEKAKELFDNAGKTAGTIVWITDGIESEDVELIADELEGTQFDVKVLAVGTEQGAPIPLPNDKGFLTDDSGDIVLPTLKLMPFQRLSQKANLAFTQMTPDNADVDFILGNNLPGLDALQNEDGDEENIEKQLDQGFWFLFALVPMLLLLFRKNTRVPGVAICLLFSMTLPESHASFWDNLWLNKNQQAAKAFREQQHEKAAALFNNSQWKGAAQYKSGDHESATENFSRLDSATAHYNKGNALARQQKYDEAIKAYEEALNRNKNHEDAQFNKQLIEELKKQQEQQQQEQQQQEQQDSDEQQQNQQDQQQESEQEQQQSEQQESEQEQQQQQDQSQESEDNEQQQAQQQEMQDDRSEAEKEQALEQWLRKIPDDPGGLLRQKMINEYKRRGRENRNTKKVW